MRDADGPELGHVNNLYNTTFWALVQHGGMSTVEAERELAVSLLGLGWTAQSAY